MDSTFKMEARSGKSLNLFTDCDHLCHVIHILYLDRIKKEKCSVPPYFLHHVQDAECDYGDLAKLHCDVTGQPDPKISWYKEEEGEPLCEYNGKYAVVQNCGHVILMIHDVTPDDIGCYTCKIRNDVGEARSTGRLFFSPAKKNQVPPSKGNHKKVIIEETVKIVERKSNPQENVSLLKQKLSHHKETEGIDTVAILFALPGGSSTKDMEVNAETGTGETYGDNVKPNDNGPGHRPCVVPCVATTASKEHTTTSSPTSSATSNSESVFDRDFDNDSSTCESSDEDLGKRVRWIETGENSDSEYRRGSIPYPMSLVPRRAQSDDTGIFSLPSAFERFSAKYSQSAGSDTTGSESTRTTPNGSDGSVDERMKKLTGLEPMRQISLASSYSSGSASSNMGVGTGVIGRTIRAMSQNEYFDTFFDEEQEVNGTEPNDTNALRHIFPVQPPLREIENENEDYPEVFDNVKNDAVIPSDANTCQSSLANAQCDVDVTSDFYKPNKSIGGHVETDEPTAFQEAYIDDLLTETEKTSSGNDIEDDEQNNKFQTEEPESNLAYHDDTIDVSTGQISIKSENISSDFFNNLNEELPFHHPISLRQLCEQQLAKPQRQIEAPCEDKTAKADALAVITRDLDVLIQTLLEFSERENVIVSSLKIGKPKRDEKDESSDGVVSISTVRPLKLALSSPQQQDEDEQNNVTQSQDVADKLAHQKPEFVISLEDMTLAWNQSTALNVSVTGCPEPTITWYCNGTPLDVDDDEVTNGIVANGEGTYMCVAKNTAGEATSSAKLIVTNTKQEKSDEDFQPDLSENSKEPPTKVIKESTMSLVDYLRSKSKSLSSGSQSHYIVTCAGQQQSPRNISLPEDEEEGDSSPNKEIPLERRGSILSFSSMSSAQYYSAEDEGSETTLDYLSPFEDGVLSTDDFFSPDSERYISPGDAKLARNSGMNYLYNSISPSNDDENLFVPRPIRQEDDFFTDYNTDGDYGTFQITAFNTVPPVISSDDQMETADSGGATPVPQPIPDDDDESDTPVCPPRFLKALDDVTTTCSESVTLACCINGFPVAQVSWYKNGVRIVTSAGMNALNFGEINAKASESQSASAGSCRFSTRTLIVGTNDSTYRHVLTITDVQETDTGEYTAAASNIFGNVISTSLLRVQPANENSLLSEKPHSTDNINAVFGQVESTTKSRAPYFDVIMEDAEVVAGNDVTFFVSMFGEPRPDVTWLKDDLRLSAQNVKTVTENERHALVIDHVTSANAGVYACQGTNSAGHVVCKAELVVKATADWSDSSDEECSSQIGKKCLKDVYDATEMVGEGSHSIVRRAQCVVTGHVFAAKYSRNMKRDRRFALNEISILSKISHPNIVKYHEAFHTTNHVVIIQELCEIELFDHFLLIETLTERIVASFILELCQALSYLHEKNIAHLSVKPENLLVVQNQLKLINFSNSVEIKKDTSSYCEWGIPDFIAYEIVKSKHVTTLTDMWPVGIVTCLAMTGVSPFSGETDQSTLFNVRDGQWNAKQTISSALPEKARDFISKLIVADDIDRMTSCAAIQHDWLDIESRDGTNEIPIEKLTLFQSKRTWQRSLVTGKSTLVRRSIPSLLRGDYSSTSLVVPRHMMTNDSSSASETESEVNDDVIKTFPSRTCDVDVCQSAVGNDGDAPMVSVQCATPLPSPAAECGNWFDKADQIGSAERPLQLNSSHPPTTLNATKNAVLSRSLEEPAHKPPIISRKFKSASFEKEKLRPKLVSVGKKVSFEDEHMTSCDVMPPNHDRNFDSDFTNDVKIDDTPSKAFEGSLLHIPNDHQPFEENTSIQDQLKHKMKGSPRRKKISSGIYRRSLEIPPSSSEESGDEQERARAYMGAQSSPTVKCCANRMSWSRGGSLDTPSDTSNSSINRKPRKGILKKGSSFETDQSTTDSPKLNHRDVIDEKVAYSGYSKRKLFTKSPSTEMKTLGECEPTSGMPGLPAVAKRRLQMRRGASAESALPPTKLRAGGLRGPLFEKRHRVVDGDMTTAGDFMRRSPAIKRVTTEGSSAVNGNSRRLKTRSFSLERPLSKMFNNNSEVSPSKLLIPEVPSPPEVTKVCGNDVWLKWPSVSNNGQLKYSLEYQDTAQLKWVIVDNSIKATSYRVTGLKSSETYRFRLAASNELGKSTFSNLSRSVSLP